jgi:hypothetical protein
MSHRHEVNNHLTLDAGHGVRDWWLASFASATAGMMVSAGFAQPVQFPTWQGGFGVTLDDRIGLVPASDGRHVQGSLSLISSITSNGVAAVFVTPQPLLGPNQLRLRDALTGQPSPWGAIPQITTMTVPFGTGGNQVPLQIDLNGIMNFVTPRVDASGAIGLLQSSQGTDGWAVLVSAAGGQLVRRLNDFAPQFGVPAVVPTTVQQRPVDTFGRRHDNGRWAGLVRLGTTTQSPFGLLGNLQEAPGSAGTVRPYLFRAGEQLTDGAMTLITTDGFASGEDLVPIPSWFFAEDGSMAVVTRASVTQLVNQELRTGSVLVLVRIDARGDRTLVARTPAPWEIISAPGFSNPKLVSGFTSGPAMNARGDIAFSSSGGLIDPAAPNFQRGSGVVVALANEGHVLRQVVVPGSSIWSGPTGPVLPPGVPMAQYSGLVTGGDVQIAESGDVYLPVNSVGSPGGLSIVCWRASENRLIRAIGFDESLANLPGWRAREVLISPLVMAINRAGQVITTTRLLGDTAPFSSQGFVGWDPQVGAQFVLPNALQFRETNGTTRSLQAASVFSSTSYWHATSMGLTNRLSERGEFVWRYSGSPGGMMTLASRIRGQCGLADVGRAGGEGFADGNLDNNDLVAFIDAFFSQSPRADVGSTGGAVGADGSFDNNDFVVFIEAFFAGCV